MRRLGAVRRSTPLRLAAGLILIFTLATLADPIRLVLLYKWADETRLGNVAEFPPVDGPKRIAEDVLSL